MKAWEIELSKCAKTGRYSTNESMFLGEEWEKPKGIRRKDLTNWLGNYCALCGVWPSNYKELDKAQTLEEIVKYYQKQVKGIKLTILEEQK